MRGRGGNEQGVQIDLLIQTARVSWLVEVKRRSRIGREIEEEMTEKLSRFPKRKGISLRTALVYEGTLDEAVAQDGFFDAISPFSSILGVG